MNGTDVGRLGCASDIDFEVPHAAKKVIGVEIPFILISHINIGGDDTQTNEA